MLSRTIDIFHAPYPFVLFSIVFKYYLACKTSLGNGRSTQGLKVVVVGSNLAVCKAFIPSFPPEKVECPSCVSI